MDPVTIIAEVASNAGGNLRRAEEFIQAFAPSVDIIKFQLTRVKHLRKDDPQYEWFQKAEWSSQAIDELIRLCDERSVLPLLTVYHPDDVDELAACLHVVKIGSGEAHSGQLAAKVLAAPFTTIYVSEGLRPAHLSYRRDPRVHMLGCITKYPAPSGLVIARWGTGQYDGWSDHAIGMNECMLAVHYGATIIEKHVQHPLQSRAPQPWEATVDEMRTFREWTRQDPDRFLGRWQNG